MGEEDVNLGDFSGGPGGSGINLRDPADSGISLEQGSSSDEEFELSLDPAGTPAPGPAAEDQSTSSSEFELSIDEGAAEAAAAPQSDSDSEFELSLDAEEAGSSPSFDGKGEADSDSEFELTLDDSGNLSEAAEEAAAGDIFETDLDVPSLDAESGSEAVALEESGTDAGGSDLDLALSEGDAPATEETGSQVVALEDEEEVGEAVDTVARPRRGALDEDLDEELGEEAAVGAAAAAAAPPAPWGPLPALVLIPTVIVLFFVSLMSFELVHSMWGYHKAGKVSGLIINPVARMFDDQLPKD
jgi:hypothetical protein